ncbi:MAG: PAS domain S-box protein [Nanoarchaeota archaeon]
MSICDRAKIGFEKLRRKINSPALKYTSGGAISGLFLGILAVGIESCISGGMQEFIHDALQKTHYISPMITALFGGSGGYALWRLAIRGDQAEEARQESEMKYRLLFESFSNPITVYTLDGTVTLINQVGARNLGKKPEEIIGANIYGLIPEMGACFKRRAYEISETRREKYVKDSILLPGGESKYFISHLQPVKDPKGNVIAIQTVSYDITTLKEMESALRLEERNRQRILDDMGAGVVVIRGSTILLANKLALETMGYTSERLRELSFTDLIPDEADKRLVIQKYMERRRGIKYSAPYEIGIRVGNGEIRQFNVVSSISKFGGEEVTLNVLTDITGRKMLEERLREAERLKVIGLAAGGLAHDINNLLMTMLGNVSLLMLGRDKDDEEYNRLRTIERAVLDCAGITAPVLEFSRGYRLNRRPATLDEVIDVYKVHSTRYPKVMIDDRIGGKDISLNVDVEQLRSAFGNLYINASQAMDGKGEMTIIGEVINIDQYHGELLTISEGRYVRIDIEDTGVGISEKDREKIFDPFFTTKGEKEGTGLGLAATYSIIKEHGGAIVVESEVGKGTRFSVYLPLQK